LPIRNVFGGKVNELESSGDIQIPSIVGQTAQVEFTSVPGVHFNFIHLILVQRAKYCITKSLGHRVERIVCNLAWPSVLGAEADYVGEFSCVTGEDRRIRGRLTFRYVGNSSCLPE
jgi:hypothetical protein